MGYENCIFNGCDFADKDLSDYKFIDCFFNGCNLSLAKINQTVFRDIKFKDCKMLGLRFDTSNEFGLSFSFDGCQLNHSSFYKTKIKKTIFKNSQLQETDFEIQKINQQLKSDEEIIDLRQKIVKSSEAQMKNGVITTSEYLNEIDKLFESKNNQKSHQIQLQLTQANYQIIKGN